ncbi:MAG TPA: hypothetical protein VNY05_26525 [Candidatus Acidoferrales bacterium]|jgi:hypothetical protein|nr:hypothetical protein [Candidatus Acidoferrales bacterium]
MTFEERQARLEQVMTALAEAQVKTEDALEDFTRETKMAQARTDAQLALLGETMNALAVHVGTLASHVDTLATHVDTLAQAQTKTEIQFQAYLNSRRN